MALSDTTNFQPSAASVINGSLAAEGEMPALALAHGGTAHTIKYKGLSRDQNYKLYCAQHDLITPGMGFDTIRCNSFTKSYLAFVKNDSN